VSFASIALDQRVFIVVSVYYRYRLSPETFGYNLVSKNRALNTYRMRGSEAPYTHTHTHILAGGE